MQIALTKCETILKSSADASARRNKERWNQLLELSRPYLVHIRAIRRWMNAIRFAFNLFNSRNGFDANPEDVAAIELIRTFEPKLYNRLAAAKSELTYETFNFRGRERDKDKVKQSFFSVVPETRRSWAEGLVDWLL